MLKTSKILLAKSSYDLIKELKADGWDRRGQDGSHITFEKLPHPHHVTVPHPKHDMGKGIVHKIEKEMECSDRDPRVASNKEAIQLTKERQKLQEQVNQHMDLDEQRLLELVDNHGEYYAWLEFINGQYTPFQSFDPEIGECWIWLGSPSGVNGDTDSKNSYGKLKWNGINVDVHVFSWYLWNKRVPYTTGKLGADQINHDCENTECFNPAHLSKMSQSQNKFMRDEAERIWKKLAPEERTKINMQRYLVKLLVNFQKNYPLVKKAASQLEALTAKAAKFNQKNKHIPEIIMQDQAKYENLKRQAEYALANPPKISDKYDTDKILELDDVWKEQPEQPKAKEPELPMEEDASEVV